MARGYSHNRTIYNQKRRRRLLSWIQHNYRLSLWGAVGVVAIILSTLQVVVLADRMPLFFVMDGQPVGGQSVAHVSSYLDNKYRQAAIILQAKGSQQQLASIQADALGVTARNRQRAEQAVTPPYGANLGVMGPLADANHPAAVPGRYRSAEPLRD